MAVGQFGERTHLASAEHLPSGPTCSLAGWGSPCLDTEPGFCKDLDPTRRAGRVSVLIALIPWACVLISKPVKVPLSQSTSDTVKVGGEEPAGTQG